MNTPHDWSNPNFSNPGRVHDWLNYVSYDLAGIWETFSDEQKKIIAANLNNIADEEHWD